MGSVGCGFLFSVALLVIGDVVGELIGAAGFATMDDFLPRLPLYLL